jgi:hypothetical protein
LEGNNAEIYQKFVSLLLIVTLQLVPVAGDIVAYAQELPSSYNFITGVQLTDSEGNPLGENIAKDSELRLTYQYAIPIPAMSREGDSLP